jgi:HD-GYP domain-containing protein (c-di-GMP phosphodiesterase class II)
LLLSISANLAPVASAVRAHHEWWDGTGYPDGLRGERIPLLGRVIAVVDVYDALTHERAYRQGRFTPEEARRMLETGRGSHFDPSLVPVYLRILDARDGEAEGARVAMLEPGVS